MFQTFFDAVIAKISGGLNSYKKADSCRTLWLASDLLIWAAAILA